MKFTMGLCGAGAISVLMVCGGCQKPSEAAAKVEEALVQKVPDVGLFCGSYVSLKYNNADAFSNERTLKQVRAFARLEQDGYLTKMEDTWSPKGLAGLSSIAGMVEYRYAPTQKYLDLMDRRDDKGCYWTKAPVHSNVTVKSEQVHPQYKTVTTVYAEADREVSKYFALLSTLYGFPGSGRVMVRALVIESPITHQTQVKRTDMGVSGGSWSTELVPEGLMAINVGGPDAVR